MSNVAKRSKPTVTALIPNFNQGQFFSDCLEGMMKQTLKPDNIVLVDDCSTDNSVEVITNVLNEKFGKSTPRIIKSEDIESINIWDNLGVKTVLVKLKKNKGRAGACNIGIGLTIKDTDFYALCDCDDIYLPHKVKDSIDVMKKYDEVGVVYTDLIEWTVETNKYERHFYRSFNYDMHCNRNICNGLSLVRAECFKHVGAYDEELRVAEDYDMWMRIAEVSVMYHLPIPGYIYRIWGKNETKTIKKDVWMKCLSRLHEKRKQRNGKK